MDLNYCRRCYRPIENLNAPVQRCVCEYVGEQAQPAALNSSAHGDVIYSGAHDAPQDASKATHGLRYDAGKPRMDLLCPIAMEGIATVMMKGAEKYAAWNWAKGMAWSKPIACLLRHTFKFMRGEDIDPESGLPHVDHIATNAMFLSRYYRENKNLDDRFKKEPK